MPPTDTALDEGTDALAGWDLPASWPASVRSTFEEVLDESPDLAGAGLSSLFAACDLLAVAASLDAVSQAAGHLATGAGGHLVSHPATVESRISRIAAAAILARLSPVSGLTRETKARRAAHTRHGNRGA